MTDEVLHPRLDRVVRRDGDVVRHPQQPWSAATRLLLKHLEDVDFPYSPRVVGQDGNTDLLSFIPGASGADGWAPVVAEEGLVACARLLYDYHQAVAGWQPEVEPRWFDDSVGSGGPGQLVCHGDFGPWNIVWDHTRPVGLLDFEYARPGDPLDDVAYACEYVVPFRSDATCLRWHRFPEPPNRRHRLEVFAAAYGLAATDGLVDRVIARQQVTVDLVAELAARGHQRQTDLVAAGHLRELQDRVDWSSRHRHLIE